MKDPNRAAEFLSKLADLFEQYDCAVGYTNADDGTHIQMDGEDVFADHLTMDAAKVLREAAASLIMATATS
jgi:hypothetical protein